MNVIVYKVYCHCKNLNTSEALIYSIYKYIYSNYLLRHNTICIFSLFPNNLEYTALEEINKKNYKHNK